MLAYVFWHWPNSQVTLPAYQAKLVNFHRTLAEHRPDGFLFSRCLRLETASWLDRAANTYEDWSIVENSAALDPLNAGAVAGACQEPHREVARWTAGSAAGLYQLHLGEADLPLIRRVYRFHKPVGMTYTAFSAWLRPLVAEMKGSLWIRQMNLGPGPEFCLQSSTVFSLPDSLQALDIAAEQVWWSGSLD